MARTPNASPPPRKIEADPPKKDDDDEIVVIEEPSDDGAVIDKPGDVVEESVEELRAQLEEERRRREEAESRSRSASEQVETAATRLLNSNMQVIENALAKEEAAKKDLRAQVIAAKERGDYDAETEALDQLQQTNLRINRLSEGKTELERQIENVKNTPEDPVERFVANMAPKSAAWVRSHPDYVTDEAKRADLEAAHYKALSMRLQVGTPAYFEAVEQELGLRDSEIEIAPQRQQRTPSRPPAARPSRDAGSLGNGADTNLPDGVRLDASGRYILSPTLQEYARISGLSNTEYLKNLLAIHNNGRTH
jgi:hypothetical protein